MNLPDPPCAEPRPHRYERHGIGVEDPYAWLRDPAYPQVRDPDILAYLTAENDYFQAAMAPHQGLVEELFQEMKGRIKEDDASVPVRDGDWEYWWAFAPGAQYRSWYRRRAFGADDGGERSEAQLILDETAEAEGKEYHVLGAISVSPDGALLAMLIDDSGAERFKLRIRDLATGADIETVTDVGIGNVVWSADSRAVLFTEVDENWRSYRARLHRIGSSSDEDRTIYEEPDGGFSVAVARSQDRSLIFIVSGNNSTTEVRYLPAADPQAEARLISPRQVDRQYEADAAHGRLWIRTNDDHVNFRLVEASLDEPGTWRTVIAGSDAVYLRGHSAFRDHLVISERLEGLDQLRLRTYDGEEHRVAFPEASYTAGLDTNPEFAPSTYRFSYSSMVTPSTIFAYHPEERRLETLKVAQIPSGYDASQYATERLTIEARDGARVPVSIVYRRGFPRDGSGKLFLYAYGAYGLAVPPGFSTSRFSLLDRGFAFAIAHIRGGDDLGHEWFLDGKLTRRWNTFNDFVDVTRGLIDAGFTSPGRIAIEGGSAGGELMGVVVNTDPELWGAVVADVPFVDVLNTMQDESLPLTLAEWPEWGNPIEDKAAFELIRSYSPYDNVKAQDYPPLLITGGLNDPRVTYWEPAKWAAKLRASKTDDNLLLLKMNMGAGHGGKSGRWEGLREIAETFAFVLAQVRDGDAV